jgi:murein L,D-transpeptidase YcbB/YkuD
MLNYFWSKSSNGSSKQPVPGRQLACCLLILFLLLSLPACASISPPQDPAPASRIPSSNATLERWVSNTKNHLHPQTNLVYSRYLGLLYRQASFGFFWLDDQGQPNAAARQLLSDLQPWLALEEHPRLKPYQELARLLQMPLSQAPSRRRQSRDLVISDYFLRYQDDLLKRYWTRYDEVQDHGVINAYESWDDWPDEVVKSSLEQVFPAWLSQLQKQNPQHWAQDRLLETRPDNQLYLPWRQAFSELQEAAEAGHWPQLEKDLQSGDQGQAVTQLAIQLARLGDLNSAQPWLPEEGVDIHEPRYDQRLEAAVQRFQQRHQITATGQVTTQTRQQLNVPPQERMRRLAHNLRRLHHLPRQRNERHLMINLADQRLQFIEQREVKLDMRVITGRDGQRTPIMNQWLTSLVLNPVWNVPPSIAQQKIFPRARNNPEYLASRDYALVDGWHTPTRYVSLDELPEDAFTEDNPSYRIVQKAGRYNQLGRAKFRLSNQQAIYLHDTPYREKFNQEERNISSGCVRVEDSEKLVEALLAKSQTWTPDRITAIYEEGEERYLQVRPRVAVYLMYWTAWTDAHGRLQWREDSYKMDQFSQTKHLAKGD